MPASELGDALRQLHIVIASASESIQDNKEELDCFHLRPNGYGGQVVASAPQ
jgi:hypothetical protein